MHEGQERTPDPSDAKTEDGLEQPTQCSACGEQLPSSRGLPKHWALVHARTVRKFLCPCREEEFCPYATSNDRNMRRHFTGRKHLGKINGEEVDARITCHRQMLKVGEYLNTSYKDPGDIPPPDGLVKYYLDAGLEPVDPKHKLDNYSLLLKSQATLYQAAKDLQVTLEVAKDESTDESEQSAVQSETQTVEETSDQQSSIIRRTHSALDEALEEEMPPLEPMTPPKLNPVTEAEESEPTVIQEYVVVQPSQEIQIQTEPSTLTSIWHVEQSDEGKFEEHLSFLEELCKCARKRKSVSDANAVKDKVSRLEAELARHQEERRHLLQLLEEREEHIKSLRQALQQKSS